MKGFLVFVVGLALIFYFGSQALLTGSLFHAVMSMIGG
jgi:hypothetical protein